MFSPACFIVLVLKNVAREPMTSLLHMIGLRFVTILTLPRSCIRLNCARFSRMTVCSCVLGSTSAHWRPMMFFRLRPIIRSALLLNCVIMPLRSVTMMPSAE